MTRIAPLRDFVVAMTKLLPQHKSEKTLLPACGNLLGDLVASDDWLPREVAEPNRDAYQQNLLYCDPLGLFSVVAFVWGPGQRTPIHDHRVWGAIGMLRGMEITTAFSRMDGCLVEGETRELYPGKVDFVSPRLGDIHRVSNALADQASISVHVYGANVGAIRRHVYDPATGERFDFVSGYSNRLMPNLWK